MISGNGDVNGGCAILSPPVCIHGGLMCTVLCLLHDQNSYYTANRVSMLKGRVTLVYKV